MLHRTVFAVLMSLALSTIMSAWVTFINLGMTEHFLQRWFEAWLLAWPAAGICAFIFGPSVHRLSAGIVARVLGEHRL